MIKLLKRILVMYVWRENSFFMVTGDIARNTTMCRGKISPEAGGLLESVKSYILRLTPWIYTKWQAGKISYKKSQKMTLVKKFKCKKFLFLLPPHSNINVVKGWMSPESRVVMNSQKNSCKFWIILSMISYLQLAITSVKYLLP